MGDFDDFPPGEIPPGVVPVKSHMDLNDVTHAAHAAIERIGRDVFDNRDAVVTAAREWRAATDVNTQDIAAQRLADAVDRLPVVFDIPGRAV